MVVTDQAVVMGHESVTADRDGSAALDGSRLLDDIGRLLESAAALLPGEGGTVIVSRPPGGWTSSPFAADAERDLRMMVADAQAAGWQPTAGWERGIDTGWFTFERPQAPLIHLGIRGMLDQSRTPLWNVADATPEHIAYQLARAHAATGQPFRMSPGVVGCAIIRAWYDQRGTNGFKKQQPLWHLKSLPSGVSTAAGELRWHRPPTDTERGRPQVVSFDQRAARLNALGMVDCLPFGGLANTGPRQFEPSIGGFWQINVAELMTNGLPRPMMVSVDRPLIPPVVNINAADADGLLWVTTPIMRWLHARHMRPLVHDSYTADKSGRWLRQPCDTMRAALRSADGDATMVKVVKEIYRQTSGMLAAPGGTIHRIDWHNSTLDQERCSVLTAAERVQAATGFLPMRIDVDELVYAVDPTCGDIDRLAAAVGVGPELGRYKMKANMPMADYCAKYGH